LTFDRPVAAGIGDVTITGAASGNRAVASIEVTGNVVTWVLSSPLSSDRYTVDLSSTLESALDGSPRQYQFAVLPGDLNDDNTVTLADLSAAYESQFRATAAGDFDPRADLNGSGTINFVDAIFLRNHIGSSLASGSPAASSPSAAAAVFADKDDRRAGKNSAPTGLRAVSRRVLAAEAVDRLIANAARPTIRDDSAADVLAASATRRSAAHGERLAAARALSRLNLDAARSGDVS
jgi:hypothetical protein